MNLSRLSRLTAILLIPALLSTNFARGAKKPIDPGVMKAMVQERGVGRGVRVTMADKTETKGVIVSVGEQSFVVKPRGAAQPQEIHYAQVIGLHNDKMGTGTKVIIIVAIAGAAIGIIVAIWAHEFKSGFPKTI
jgi:ABC-type phosphate transport system permease subunit